MDGVIVCYGEIGIDRFVGVSNLPEPEVSAYVHEDFYNVGGGAANSALWLANWGVSVRLVGQDLGRDLWNDQIKSQLAQYPTLDTRFLRSDENTHTAECQCLVTPNGERTFIVHWPDPIEFSTLTEEMLEDATWLSLDQSGPREPRIVAAQVARAHGIPILVNDIISVDDPLIELASVLVISVGFTRARLPNTDVLTLARDMQKRSGGIVVVTNAGARVTGLTSNGKTVVVTPPQVKVIDSTGAGDVFKAGLLYGLAQDWTLEDTLQFAVAAGAAKVQRKGATRTPAPLSDIEQLVSKIELPGSDFSSRSSAKRDK